jgi:hypothetical protein
LGVRVPLRAPLKGMDKMKQNLSNFEQVSEELKKQPKSKAEIIGTCLGLTIRYGIIIFLFYAIFHFTVKYW